MVLPHALLQRFGPVECRNHFPHCGYSNATRHEKRFSVPNQKFADIFRAGASRLHPTAHSPRGGGSGLAALLLPRIFTICSVVAPGQSGRRAPKYLSPDV